MPGQFPLVKPLSTAQEEHFRRASMPDLDPSLAPGVVKQWGQWVKSAPIEVDGKATRWRILGIYDLLAHYDDGSVGIIDCKVSDSDRDNAQFYAPQLEAYAYALENPEKRKAIPGLVYGALGLEASWRYGDSRWRLWIRGNSALPSRNSRPSAI